MTATRSLTLPGSGPKTMATVLTTGLLSAGWRATSGLSRTVGGSTAGATPEALGAAAARASRTRWCCSALTAWVRPAPRLRKGNWGCKAMMAPPTRCPRCQGRLELQRPDPALEVLRCLMCGRDAAWRPVAVYRPAAEADKNPVETGTPPTAGAIRMAQRRSLFRMRGMCQVCGKVPVGGHFACPDCAARRKEVSYAFRQRRKDAGAVRDLQPRGGACPRPDPLRRLQARRPAASGGEARRRRVAWRVLRLRRAVPGASAAPLSMR